MSGLVVARRRGRRPYPVGRGRSVVLGLMGMLDGFDGEQLLVGSGQLQVVADVGSHLLGAQNGPCGSTAQTGGPTSWIPWLIEWIDFPGASRAASFRVYCLPEAPVIQRVEALLGSGRRGPSLVDCVKFVGMRQEGIVAALALDAHFATQGFWCYPEVSVE